MSETRLTKFAFWPYDRPPYVLGSETDGKRDNEGRVEVPSYGVGARVRPIKIMNADKGRQILVEIQRRDAIRRAACDSAMLTFRQDALSVAPFLKELFSRQRQG